jgi:catechol 2,3-dioxygenase-like lactoylglutathione lyase family enzyme
MKRRYDHIDLRVRSLAEAQPFYQAVLPALGFTRDDSNERWLELEAAGEGITDYFAITESPSHQPDESRIAFWADSIAEVDRLASVVVFAGARCVEGPAYETPCHYAVFFEDPCGNRFEICHRTEN